MTKINIKSIADTINGATTVHVTYRTPVVLLGGKKNEQQGRVEKVTVTPAMMFSENNVSAYQQMVRRRQAGEGVAPTFEVGAPVWGWKDIAPGVVEYTKIDKDTGAVVSTTRYLKFIKTGKSRSQYLLDGQPVDVSMIQGLKEYKPAKEESQGGIENKVDIRIVKLENLTRLAAKGKKLTGEFTYE